MIQKIEGNILNPFPEKKELDAAALLREAALFAEAPKEDDCPICGFRLPMKNGTITSKSCFLSERFFFSHCTSCDALLSFKMFAAANHFVPDAMFLAWTNVFCVERTKRRRPKRP